MPRPVAAPFACFAGAALIAVLLGCGGNGNKHKCVAGLSYMETRYSSVGTGASEQAARANAVQGTCLFYCEYGDSAVESQYQTWRATPDGQKPGAAADKGVAIGFEPQLKQTVERCKLGCNQAVQSGRAPVRTKCQ